MPTTARERNGPFHCPQISDLLKKKCERSRYQTSSALSANGAGGPRQPAASSPQRAKATQKYGALSLDTACHAVSSIQIRPTLTQPRQQARTPLARPLA